MCYFPLTYLGAYVMYHIAEQKERAQKWMGILVAALSSVYVIVIVALPWVGKHAAELANSGRIKDAFAVANLQADVFWGGWESLIALILVAGSILFFRYWRKQLFYNAFGWLYGSMAIFTFVAMFVITPRVEGYTQRAVIEFYQEIAHDDIYVQPLGFKSYAHYFYAERMPADNQKSKDKNWLLTGDIDKKAWFVVKVHKKEQYMKSFPHLKEYKSKNGFVFFYREPENIYTTPND